MATSISFAIPYPLQSHTLYDHSHIDDISAILSNNTELMINGGFEMNGYLIFH
jgi:hypothetical protein